MPHDRVHDLWHAFRIAALAHLDNPSMVNLVRRIEAYMAWRRAYLREAA